MVGKQLLNSGFHDPLTKPTNAAVSLHPSQSNCRSCGLRTHLRLCLNTSQKYPASSLHPFSSVFHALKTAGDVSLYLTSTPGLWSTFQVVWIRPWGAARPQLGWLSLRSWRAGDSLSPSWPACYLQYLPRRGLRSLQPITMFTVYRVPRQGRC